MASNIDDQNPKNKDGFDFNSLNNQIDDPGKPPVQDSSDVIISSSRPVKAKKSKKGKANSILAGDDYDNSQVSSSVKKQFSLNDQKIAAQRDDASESAKLKRAVLSNIASSISDEKSISRIWLPKIKSMLPTKLYGKVGSLIPDGELTAKTVNAKLIKILAIQQELSADQYIRNKSDAMVRSKISLVQHAESITVLSSILTMARRNNAFLQGTLKKYLMTSIELKYKHIFVTKDILKHTKMLLATTSSKLDVVKHNTALPNEAKITAFGELVSVLKSRVGPLIAYAMSGGLKKYVDSKTGDLYSMVKELAISKFHEFAQHGPVEFTRGKVEPGTKLGELAKYHTREAITKAKAVSGYGQRAYGRPDMTMVKPEETQANSHVSKLVQYITGGDQAYGVANIKHNLTKTGDQRVNFDVITRRAIIDIIPGFLAKIHRESAFMAKMMRFTSTHGMNNELRKHFDKSTATGELVFDRNTESFTSAEEFEKSNKDFLYGDKANRTEKVKPLINQLHAGFTQHGGSDHEFKEALPDIVKFVNNITKHARVVKLDHIKTYLTGGKLSEQEQDYMDAILVDVPVSSRKRLVKILGTSFFKDKKLKHVDTDFTKVMGHLITKGIEDKDNDYESLRTLKSYGDHRHMSSIYDPKTGKIKHGAIRAIHSDVDYAALSSGLKINGQRGHWGYNPDIEEEDDGTPKNVFEEIAQKAKKFAAPATDLIKEQWDKVKPHVEDQRENVEIAIGKHLNKADALIKKHRATIDPKIVKQRKKVAALVTKGHAKAEELKDATISLAEWEIQKRRALHKNKKDNKSDLATKSKAKAEELYEEKLEAARPHVENVQQAAEDIINDVKDILNKPTRKASKTRPRIRAGSWGYEPDHVDLDKPIAAVKKMSKKAADAITKKTGIPNHDSPKISGPGVYFQGTPFEIHIPLIGKKKRSGDKVSEAPHDSTISKRIGGWFDKLHMPHSDSLTKESLKKKALDMKNSIKEAVGNVHMPDHASNTIDNVKKNIHKVADAVHGEHKFSRAKKSSEEAINHIIDMLNTQFHITNKADAVKIKLSSKILSTDLKKAASGYYQKGKDKATGWFRRDKDKPKDTESKEKGGLGILGDIAKSYAKLGLWGSKLGLKGVKGTAGLAGSAAKKVFDDRGPITDFAANAIKKTAGAYGSYLKGAFKVQSAIFKGGYHAVSSVAKRATNLYTRDKHIDVYLKDHIDLGSPLMKGLLIKSGHYIYANGKPVTAAYDITGPVFDGETKQLVVSIDDIKKGLVDHNNKPIETPGKKIMSAIGVTGGLMGRAAKAYLSVVGGTLNLTGKVIDHTATAIASIFGKMPNAKGLLDWLDKRGRRRENLKINTKTLGQLVTRHLVRIISLLKPIALKVDPTLRDEPEQGEKPLRHSRAPVHRSKSAEAAKGEHDHRSLKEKVADKTKEALESGVEKTKEAGKKVASKLGDTKVGKGVKKIAGKIKKSKVGKGAAALAKKMLPAGVLASMHKGQPGQPGGQGGVGGSGEHHEDDGTKSGVAGYIGGAISGAVMRSLGWVLKNSGKALLWTARTAIPTVVRALVSSSALLVDGIALAAEGITAGVAAIVGSPIVLAGLAIAGIGALTYGTYRWFSGNKRRKSLTELRNQGYKVPSKKIDVLVDFEDYINDSQHTKSDPKSAESKTNDFIKKFDLDPKDKEHMAFFKYWYTGMFLPIYNTSVGIIERQYKIKWDDQEKLKDDQIDKYRETLTETPFFKSLKGLDFELSPSGFKTWIKTHPVTDDTKKKEEEKKKASAAVIGAAGAVGAAAAAKVGLKGDLDNAKPSVGTTAAAAAMGTTKVGLSADFDNAKPSAGTTAAAASGASTSHVGLNADFDNAAKSTISAPAAASKTKAGFGSEQLLKKNANAGSDSEYSKTVTGKNKSSYNSAQGWESVEGSIMKQLKSYGWTDAQAAGIAANIRQESQGKADAVGDGKQAYGIGQWHPDRQRGFEKFAGKSIKGSTLEEQVAFYNYELQKGEYNEQTGTYNNAAGRALKNATTAQEAGAIVSSRLERPRDKQGEAAKRGASAVAIEKRIGSSSTDNVASNSPATPAAAPGAASTPAAAPAAASTPEVASDAGAPSATPTVAAAPTPADNSTGIIKTMSSGNQSFNNVGSAASSPAIANVDRTMNKTAPVAAPAPPPVAPPVSPLLASSGSQVVNVNDPESKQQTGLLQQQNDLLGQIAKLLSDKGDNVDSKAITSKLDGVIAAINQSGGAAGGNSSDTSGASGGNRQVSQSSNNPGIDVSRVKATA